MVLASLMFCSSVTWPLGNPSKLKQHYGTSIFRKPSLTRCQAKRSCDCYDMCKELIPYAKAWSWQKAIVDRRKEQIERNEDLADTLIILQHQPVYTLGTGSTEGNLHFDIKNPPFELYRTERGGEVTYHGPGQLVMYPIINLGYHKMDLHWYLRSLEEVIIRVLSSSFSMEASRIDGLTGVWVADKLSKIRGRIEQGMDLKEIKLFHLYLHRFTQQSEDQKLAAIGIRASQWVTYHGLALNITTDMAPFQLIVPCGFRDRQVGSIKGLLRNGCGSEKHQDTDDVQLVDITHKSLVKEFCEVFQVDLHCKPTPVFSGREHLSSVLNRGKTYPFEK